MCTCRCAQYAGNQQLLSQKAVHSQMLLPQVDTLGCNVKVFLHHYTRSKGFIKELKKTKSFLAQPWPKWKREEALFILFLNSGRHSICDEPFYVSGQVGRKKACLQIDSGRDKSLASGLWSREVDYIKMSLRA